MVFDTLLSRTRLRERMEDLNNLETGLAAQVRLPDLSRLLAPTERKDRSLNYVGTSLKDRRSRFKYQTAAHRPWQCHI
jgi:hypothetical protein